MQLGVKSIGNGDFVRRGIQVTLVIVPQYFDLFHGAVSDLLDLFDDVFGGGDGSGGSGSGSRRRRVAGLHDPPSVTPKLFEKGLDARRLHVGAFGLLEGVAAEDASVGERRRLVLVDHQVHDRVPANAGGDEG